MSEETLYLRAPNLGREAQIDDFQQLDAVCRFNDVGSWALDMDARMPHALTLTKPGYGIELVRDGKVIISGDMRYRKRTNDGDKSRILVSGYDDNVWLHRRQAHPQPTTAAPPYSAQEHDVRTGVASTVLSQYVDVNLGPAALSARRVPGLVIATDPLIGASVTGRARWQRLLVVLQELALVAGLGFRLQKSGSTRVFSVYQPVDRTGNAVFSTEMGNLAGYEYDAEAPSTNYVFVGGGGEGVLRTVREVLDTDSVVEWGRIEEFVDRRDTTVDAELVQAGAKSLEEGSGKFGMSLDPIETENQRYLIDYDLGDRVTGVLDGEPVKDVIREVRLKRTPEGPQQTLPALSSPGQAPEVLRVFRKLRSAEQRLTNLERR